MEFIYITKNKIKIIKYCKHGDLITDVRHTLYKNKNFCQLCSEEILNNSTIYEIDEDIHKDIIQIIKDKNKKISIEKLKLWYPKLYKKINSLTGKNWTEKICLFKNELDSAPICDCGNPIKINKKGIYLEKCEHCNRSSAVEISTRSRSVELWENIFKKYFKIDNPIFRNIDKYRLEIIVNDKPLIIKKALVIKLKKLGILDIDNIEIPDEDVEKYIKEYKKHSERYHVGISDLTLRGINPFIWRSLHILKEKKYKNIENFNEFKFLVLNDLAEPPKCTMCNKPASYTTGNQTYCVNCDEHKFSVFVSRGETEVHDFIKTFYSKEIKRNYKILGHELDMFFPDKYLAIEYNGVYWHSDNFKEKTHHYDKWKKFKDNGIDVMFIWEDDWKFKKEIIESILLNRFTEDRNHLTKIYARNCKIIELDYKNSKLFLEKNHIQGFVPAKNNIGLLYKDELVSIMTFGNRKISGNKCVELLRFCNKLNFNIIGGSSKMFNYYIKKYLNDNEKIISYCNLELFTGNIYKKLGFSYIGHTALNYWWTKGSKKFNRGSFMKHILVRNGEDPTLTENQIMKKNNYFKIWSIGNSKWIYQKTPII